jgi:dihydrofolate synthase/folylpolyglutamate synthase
MAWRTASGVFTRGVDGTVSQRLRQLLTRLDELVNWERLQRANTGQRQREMRVDVKPAKRLLDALGSPQHCYRAVHIAGTKGKGTLAAMLTAYLVKQKGFRVGTYTSPHVERIQERVRLQGACIEDEALADALESALAAADPFLQDGVPMVERPTWFDVMTAAGFLAMKTAGVEYAVIECGMGGAKDSTNVLGAEVCLLTSVALEHAEIIGPGLADIAREKAGIAWRPSCILISGVHQPELRQVIRETVEQLSPPAPRSVVFVDAASWEERNQLMAERAIKELAARYGWLQCEPPDWSLLQPQMKQMLPGRMEWFALHRGTLSVNVLVDGAHIPETVQRLPCGAWIVLAMGRDKRVEEFTEALMRFAPRAIICTRVGDDPSYMPADELHERAHRVVANHAAAVSQTPVFKVALPEEALRRAVELAATAAGPEKPHSVVCIGSLHLAGIIRRTLLRDWNTGSIPDSRTSAAEPPAGKPQAHIAL